MEYDLIIKNGRIVDGSGMPSFSGDVGVSGGKIAELGRLGGPAKRTIDAGGMVVAPGFIDNHCHYDAQVTWDPLCSFSCYQGATSVVIGNCSLTVAPAQPAHREKLAGMLSQVEAIPMDVLAAGLAWDWESFPQYMNVVGKRLAVNVGTMIGHSAIRLYAMGEASQERSATEAELEMMRGLVREALEAGALGLSISRNMTHFDIAGNRIPATYAPEEELFALAAVLREVGTGILQSGGGASPELKDRLMSRLSEASGRRVIYNNIQENVRSPEQWKKHLALVEETCGRGLRALPMCSPCSLVSHFTMKNCQTFRQLPAWRSLMLLSDAEKLAAYGDPEMREKLRAELDYPLPSGSRFSIHWNLLILEESALPQNRELKGKDIATLATARGREPLDTFLDLAVEEELNTQFSLGQINIHTEAVAAILNSPYTVVGLSDGGAHVQFHSEVGYSTRLLGYWVREQGIMPLEKAVRRLTFDSASAYGIYDRGLLQPGMAADQAGCRIRNCGSVLDPTDKPRRRARGGRVRASPCRTLVST
jgi:N-acyl-D-aspartate/D-glutamate deacylase